MSAMVSPKGEGEPSHFLWFMLRFGIRRRLQSIPPKTAKNRKS